MTQLADFDRLKLFILFRFIIFFLGEKLVRSGEREQSLVPQSIDRLLELCARLVELVEEAACAVAFVELQVMIVVELRAVQEWKLSKD